MTIEAKEPPPDAGKLPTGRIARTARVGGFVTGQGVRWAGMRTANRVRSPERAAAAQNERTAALVNELVEQLGQMRGAAMKVVQELLGHATIEMTMRYAHLSPDVPRQAVKLLDGLGSSVEPWRQAGDKARVGT